MDLKERVAAATLPMCGDGTPDCDNWGPYVNQIGLKTLGEMNEAIMYLGPGNWHALALVFKAIQHRKEEIAAEFFKQLQSEGLTNTSATFFLRDLESMFQKLVVNQEKEG